MATVSDGNNPGRQGASPSRQSPSPKYNGRAAGGDPTEEPGQTPAEIFGFAQSYSTGAKGTSGGGGSNSDVTVQPGQFDTTLAHVTEQEITDTGLHGSAGAANANGGPDSITYTDPFGYMGNDHRESRTSAHVDGLGDWTQANDQGYEGGPTLPSLEGNRPTSTGIGQGHVSAKHPNAGA